ncbi:peptidase [Nitrosopumilus oxyclinae]|uniref:peptidase n=1 Tax=Nitrosopumilus oxyclinae TaxID=1959104 RepID=UPI0031B5D082
MACRIVLDLKYFALVATFSILLIIPQIDAEASSNPNLFVSAENSQFDNSFSGSMVVEVIVIDPNLSNTDQGKGEPDVTINGKSLRMTQATDGSWYAYFANVDKAKQADSTVGLAGEGLDFGVFCSRNTLSSIVGISLSETDGFAIPRAATGSTNGNTSFSDCTASPTGAVLNNVVRNAKSINTNPNVPSGQIGLNTNAWPLIQLYSFNEVIIQYNPAGSPQMVSLEYDESQNISMNIDRVLYPKNAEVFLTINDFQLNQDPTDEDSWTFDVGNTPSTFYQAFDENGQNAANGWIGLVDLIPNLSKIGFEDNGKLSVNLNSVIELQSNDEQPTTSVSDGTTTYVEIITLVEDGPNSGIFDTADNNDQSILGILDSAPRGQTGSITYNKNSISVLTGSSSASVSLENPTLTIETDSQSLNPGSKIPVILVDPDQNINSDARDHLDVFRSTAIIPSITIGNPVTFQNAQDVQFHSSSPILVGGDDSNSSVPDTNSDRLVIDSSNVANGTYEMISMNLGVSASSLSSILLDVSNSNTDGTNWINYDLRSFENDYGITDFSDTSFTLSFGTLGTSSIAIIDAGDISSSQGFIQIDDSDIANISNESGMVFLVIDFDSTGSGDTLTISSEENKQPIVFDFFSFGIKNSKDVNNSIYRFELEETSDNSSTFDGTMEYSVANQLNIFDPVFIETIQPIDDQIKFIVTDRLINDKGIFISYSDLDATGVFTTTSSQSNIQTTAGMISSDSKSYRFGQPVTLTLNDPDLNLKNDLVDIYFVIDDPNSPNVDTVGKNGITLLEVLIKDIRYKRCTVDGVSYGGLGATGFTLVETGPSTGIFNGVFKMPSKICNKSGTAIISSAGGSLDAKYYDSRDNFGNANVFSLLRAPPTSYPTSAQLSTYEIVKPTAGQIEEILLSGKVDTSRRGIPLDVIITTPDGQTQNFGATLSSAGSFKSIISINENTLSGVYKINLFHNNSLVKSLSFVVSNPPIPDWIKNNAKWWSSDSVSDSEFIDGLEYLIEKGLIIVNTDSKLSISDQLIPDWIKNNAKWWADGEISDDDFVKSIQFLVKKGIIRI